MKSFCPRCGGNTLTAKEHFHNVRKENKTVCYDCRKEVITRHHITNGIIKRSLFTHEEYLECLNSQLS
jgi:hypothetical protein